MTSDDDGPGFTIDEGAHWETYVLRFGVVEPTRALVPSPQLFVRPLGSRVRPAEILSPGGVARLTEDLRMLGVRSSARRPKRHRGEGTKLKPQETLGFLRDRAEENERRTHARVLALARRHGLLGWSQLQREPVRFLDDPEEPEMAAEKVGTRAAYDHALAEFRRRSRGDVFEDGWRPCACDPVHWIRGHARNVAICLELIEGLRRGGDALLARTRRLFADLFWRQDADRAHPDDPDQRRYSARLRARLRRPLLYPDLEGGPPKLVLNWIPTPLGEVEWPADLIIPRSAVGKDARVTEVLRLSKQILEALLNPNLGRVERRIRDGRTVLHFQVPIQLVYWNVADRLSGAALAACAREACGGSFLPTDARQRYCRPACANAEAQRRHRERVKAEAKRKRSARR